MPYYYLNDDVDYNDDDRKEKIMYFGGFVALIFTCC